MRGSTKYLAWMPVKFSCHLWLSFGALLVIFRVIESRAAAHTGIHDTLGYYVFLLALLPALSGLMAMLERFFDMRFSETRLIEYLHGKGIAIAC